MVRTPSRSRRAVFLVVTATMIAASCSNDGRELRPPRPDQGESVAPVTTVPVQDFAVTAEWAEGAAIDRRHTCDGGNISPALSWTAGPAGTASYAIVLEDLDAPDWAHWTVANIPADVLSVAEGTVPEGAVVALAQSGAAAYEGPCPPEGATHTYSITVFALSQVVSVAEGSDAPTVRAAVEGVVLAETSTSFTFAR